MRIWNRGRLRHSVGIETPPANPGEPQIHVTFHVDAQGKLTITARDEGSDEDLPVLRR